MKIVTNTAMSADGKIGPLETPSDTLGSAEDKRRMSLLRREADAILVGGTTFRSYPKALIEKPAHLLDPSTRKDPLWNVILSKSLDLPVNAPAFSDPRVRVLVITEGTSSPGRLFGPDVEIVALPEVNARTIVSHLAERKVETLVIEAGGETISQFFHAGLVDEMYLTIAPRILGGTRAPTPVSGAPFPLLTAPTLTLLEATVIGDEIFLRYRVSRDARS